MKQAKSAFQIVGGMIQYTNAKFADEVIQIKNDCEGSWGEAIYQIVDSVKYFQHKYLHGYLLPDICFTMGETDSDYVKQFVLKTKFLYRDIPDGDIKKIPNKHLKNCRIVTRLEDEKEVVKGYIPSTTVLTFDEMNQFLKDCENLLIFDLNSNVGRAGDNQTEALQARGMANLKDMVGSRQEDLFNDK
jgi:hypothetical protein